MKQMLLPGAEELSADAPLLVQTQLGLVGFSWPPPISSWTQQGGLPLRPSALMQSLLLSSDDEIWRKYARKRETSPEDY